ncbi:MAG TPA: NAD(P)-dependent alcohol dehydrogenase [Candidatus Limnocylindria bacterium]|jgi:alcohol dehydrogenase (NADP+)|nr:NAD(P)-dependent alcohol dehydrogenase [Candidatus Limnocylindria bacterium]
MIPVKGYAAQSAASPLAPFDFKRRDLRPKDVLIDILYCGICHSDLHLVRNEWGRSIYPMVPGHEIVGRVVGKGNRARRFKKGDLAAVGCFVDSCRKCSNCKDGLQQYCTGGLVLTYNSYEKDGKTITRGGYSTKIVVDEDYVLKVPSNLPLEKVAPLLCAGITTYSPVRHWKIGKGHRVAVLGLGGLGHMAVKFASAFGATVTVLSGSPNKQRDAKRMGATDFALTRDAGKMKTLSSRFDFIIDTVSATHDFDFYLGLLRTNGVMICVGLPSGEEQLSPFNLVLGRRSIAGSLIGGLPETQEMLNYCGRHQITSDVEVIPIQQVNEAYDRMVKSDVRYRFVIDLVSLK